MKNLKILLFFFLSFIFVYCQKNVIKIRPEDLYVSASAGTYKVKVKHADWIERCTPNGKVEKKGDYQKGGTVYVASSDWIEALYYPKLEYMTVNVSENTTGEERSFGIFFSSGNYSGQMGIYQSAE